MQLSGKETVQNQYFLTGRCPWAGHFFRSKPLTHQTSSISTIRSKTSRLPNSRTNVAAFATADVSKPARKMDNPVAVNSNMGIAGAINLPVSFNSLRILNAKLIRCVTRKLKKYPSIPYFGRSKNSRRTSKPEVSIL